MPKTPAKTASKAKKPKVKKTQKAAEPKVEVKPKVAKSPAKHYFYACGKRKTSTALVRLYVDGKGIITVNNRTFENYFPVLADQDKVLSPLRLTNNIKTFDVSVRVKGGGIHSQAEAVRHGISKALLEYSADLRLILKPAGFLTRDPRVKERKKYGLKRARRAPQWAKR